MMIEEQIYKKYSLDETVLRIKQLTYFIFGYGRILNIAILIQDSLLVNDFLYTMVTANPSQFAE
jgi:hypothetical protein